MAGLCCFEISEIVYLRFETLRNKTAAFKILCDKVMGKGTGELNNSAHETENLNSG